MGSVLLHKVTDIIGRRDTGQKYITKGIDGRLYDDIGNCKHGTLNAGGQANANDLKKRLLIEPHLFQRKFAGIRATHQRNYNQGSGNCLGNNRSQRNTVNGHFEDDYKENIKSHIDYAGDHQEDKGTFGVTCGSENRSTEIIDHGKGDARKIDLHIKSRLLNNVFRRSHPNEKSL